MQDHENATIIAAAIRDLAERAAAAATVEDVCEAVLHSFVQNFQPEGAELLVTRRNGELRPGAASGLTPAGTPGEHWVPWSKAPERPDPVVVDEEWVSRGAAPTALLDQGLRQAVFVPLILPERLIGAVALYYAAPRSFAPVATALADALGLQAAIAMHRRRTEASLHSRQQMLAHFVEGAPIGLKLVDRAGLITWANPAELALLGLTADQYVGRSIEEFFENDRQRALIRDAIAASRDFDNLEASLRHEDGSVRHVLLSGRHVWEDEEQPRICCFLRDITDRKRDELEQQFLLESSQILSTSLEYAETLERLTRLPVPDHADWSLLDMAEDEGRARLVAVAHRDPAKIPLLRSVRERYPVQAGTSRVPAVLVLRTGRPMLVSTLEPDEAARYGVDAVHVEIIRQLDPRSLLTVPLLLRGSAIGTLTWVRTVGRSPFDHRDLRLAEELARSAASAVEHARLYEEAQEANRLKDIFLANVSHELRTPMNAISGWTSMLARHTPPNAPWHQAIEAIARNAAVQARLIDDLLDVSRIVGGKLRLELAEVEIDRPILAAIETVRPAADAKRLRIELRSECVGEMVTGDPDRLQQVFWNLLSNAIKFSAPDGHILVLVRRAVRAVEVQVSDVGRGIAPRLLPHVFDTFRQADTKPGEGLGLGLAIVRHLVEMHGGEVRAASAGEGFGATFTVVLPATGAGNLAEATRGG